MTGLWLPPGLTAALRIQRQILANGARIPKGYGIAWHEYDRDVFVCYRWPLNILLGAFRSGWLAVRWFQWGLSAYERGYMHGKTVSRSDSYDRGFEAGREAGIRIGSAVADQVVADLLHRLPSQ